MTDTVDDSNVHSVTKTLGDTLKAAREEKKLSIEQVCASLRISQRQVIALETNDFNVLPDAMITRGFIRNYSRLLGIDSVPLLDAYVAQLPENNKPLISMRSENIAIANYQKRLWMPYVVASIVILFSLIIWYVYMDYMPKIASGIEQVKDVVNTQLTSTSSEVQPSTEEAKPATTAPFVASPEQNQADPLLVSQSLPEVALPRAERQPELVDTTAPVPQESQITSVGNQIVNSVSTSAQGALVVSCTSSSWVNVLDKNNKQIFDQILTAGSQQAINGEPPFKVIVGNAPSTKVIYKNQNIDLGPYTKVRVARLTLE